MQGRITKGIAGFYYVYVDGYGLVECRAKGVFRKDGRKPLVGDCCEVEILDEQERTGSVVKLLPRKNALIRPEVANVDETLLIFAVTSPAPNLNLLDRCLVMMEQQGVPARICLNKTDLASDDACERLRDIYRASGYPVCFTSAGSGLGIEELKESLQGHTTVVAGPSGVGKSSIINCLQGQVTMQTGAISRKISRGRHTTRHSEIIPVNADTFIFDTPGFSSLRILDCEKEELREFFPEFRRFEGKCRFQGCVHVDEPDCAVKQAVSEGIISTERYEHYRQLFEEQKNRRKY